MSEVFQFVVTNWGAIAAVLLAVSELLALTPLFKGNGLLHAAILYLKK
jgi:hypothetical protein